MLVHIVMFTFRDEVDGKPKSVVCREIKEMLDALPSKIPCIKRFDVGINAVPSDASDDLVLVSEFESLEDLQSYAAHPEHVRVADVIGKARLTRNAVDYFV